MLKEHWHIYLSLRDAIRKANFLSEKCRHNLRKECQEGSIPIESHWPHCRAIPDPVEIDIASFSLPLSRFTIFFASSYALRRRRVSPGRKFHPRIAQLIPRSCQSARGTTTPRRRCVLSKLDTYRSTTPRVHPFIDWLISSSIFFFPRRRRDIACSHYNSVADVLFREIFLKASPPYR